VGGERKSHCFDLKKNKDKKRTPGSKTFSSIGGEEGEGDRKGKKAPLNEERFLEEDEEIGNWASAERCLTSKRKKSVLGKGGKESPFQRGGVRPCFGSSAEKGKKKSNREKGKKGGIQRILCKKGPQKGGSDGIRE